MRVRRNITVCVFAASFALIMGIFIVRREPSYAGVGLSEWLDRLYRLGPNDEEAVFAVRQIGTRAVPRLLAMLRQKDSAIKIKLVRLLAKQSTIRVRFSWAGEQHEKAARGFQALGPVARDAMLPLVALLNDTNASAAQMPWGSFPPYPPAAHRALQALGVDVMLEAIPLVTNEKFQRWLYHDLISMDFLYGNELDRIVPVIGRVLEECRFADIRAEAAALLGSRQRWPELEIPLLTRSLIRDPDLTVKQSAAYALSCYGAKATNAIPALLRARSVKGLRRTAILALNVIDPALNLVDPAGVVDPATGLPRGPDWPPEELLLPEL